MATTQDIAALLKSKDGYAALSQESQERLHLMVGDVEEVVGVEHLIQSLQGGRLMEETAFCGVMLGLSQVEKPTSGGRCSPYNFVECLMPTPTSWCSLPIGMPG